MWSMRRIFATSATFAATWALGTPWLTKRIGDVLAHVHVRVEGEHLEDHGDIALGGRLLADVLAVDQDLAGGRKLQPGDHAQGGGLAAARGAEEHEELAVLDGEGRAFDGGERAEFLAEVSDDDFSQGEAPARRG